MQLNPRAFGLASAIICGVFWLITMPIAFWTGIGDVTLQTWGKLYPFFSYDWLGVFIMVIENFVYGLVSGWIFAWLYNKLLK